MVAKATRYSVAKAFKMIFSSLNIHHRSIYQLDQPVFSARSKKIKHTKFLTVEMKVFARSFGVATSVVLQTAVNRRHNLLQTLEPVSNIPLETLATPLILTQKINTPHDPRLDNSFQSKLRRENSLTGLLKMHIAKSLQPPLASSRQGLMGEQSYPSPE